MQRIIFKVVKAIIWALLAVQLAVSGLLIVGNLSGHQVVVITGGSMEPVYHLGSAVLLDDAPRTPTVGDVVTFYGSNKVLVTHRVLSLHDHGGELYLQTKGDANPAPDHDLVSVKEVIGEPRMSAAGMGYAIDFLTSPVGKLLTFGPVLALFAGREIRRILISVRRGEDGSQAGTAEVAA